MRRFHLKISCINQMPLTSLISNIRRTPQGITRSNFDTVYVKILEIQSRLFFNRFLRPWPIYK